MYCHWRKSRPSRSSRKEQKVEHVSQILSRNKENPCLIGELGVRKLAVVEGFGLCFVQIKFLVMLIFIVTSISRIFTSIMLILFKVGS